MAILLKVESGLLKNDTCSIEQITPQMAGVVRNEQDLWLRII